MGEIIAITVMGGFLVVVLVACILSWSSDWMDNTHAMLDHDAELDKQMDDVIKDTHCNEGINGSRPLRRHDSGIAG